MPLSTSTEIETKFLLPSADLLRRIPALLRNLQAVCAKPRTRQVTDTYCDTPEFGFYRAGYASRIRQVRGESGADWTLKSLHRPREGVATRQELTERLNVAPKLPLARLPGRRLARQIGDQIATHRLVSLFTLIQRRRVFEATWAATGLGVEVSLDVTRRAGGRERLAIVELELIRGTPAALKAVTRDLRKALNIRTAPPSKFVWAVRRAGIVFPIICAHANNLNGNAVDR